VYGVPLIPTSWSTFFASRSGGR